MMNKLELTSHGFRRARTRSLVQLGGLISKAGLLETFGIQLGLDLQKDPDMRDPIAALYKGLLILNEQANSEDVHQLWALQGLQAFGEEKKGQASVVLRNKQFNSKFLLYFRTNL